MASSRRLPAAYNVSTYGGAGRDYTSLAAWESDTDNDLVAAARGEVLECYADASYFNDRVALSGATANSSYFRVIKSASGQEHSGIPGQGVTFSSTTDLNLFTISEANACVYDICATLTPNSANNRAAFAVSSPGVHGCVGCIAFSCANAGTGVAYGFTLTNTGGGARAIAVNCLAARCEDAGFLSTGGQTLHYNCTSVLNAYGFRNSGATGVRAKNCCASGNTTADWDGTFGTVLTNTSEGASPDYVNPTIDDYHLASGDAVCKDKGTVLSTDPDYAFDDDIDGRTRSGTWDIGFDEHLVTSISNPADLADNPTHHILAVDTHVHSLFDHMFDFLDPYATARFARDAMRLDGIILVDHGWIWHTDSRWSAQTAYQIQKAAALAYTSDRFFCGQGFEWTQGQSSSGCGVAWSTNHHVIFPFPIQAADYSVGYDCRVLRSEQELIGKLDSVGHDYIIIPHPMQEEKDWDHDMVGGNEVVGEIISYKAGYHRDKGEFLLPWPRCFEIGGKYSFRYAWSRGKRLGVIGSSDCHIGHPGVPNWPGWGNKDGHNYGYQRPGLAMILASSPDSCGCFRALRNRRCYATSGVRMFVDFQVTAKQGGSPVATAMQGQTLTLAAGTYDFEVYARVAAPANLKVVEVYRYDPANPTGGDYSDGFLTVDQQAAAGARHLERTFTVSGVTVGDDPFLFYLFAQQDEGAYAGNAAWSSPVWVEKA